MKKPKQKNKFAICIPTLNRADLLIPQLLLYSLDFPNTDIFIYDNGTQIIDKKLNQIRAVRGLRNVYEGLKHVTVLGGIGNNIGVAASWNILCEIAFEKYDYVLMLNDDVYLHCNEFDINCMIPYMKSTGTEFLRCEEKFQLSVFLISKKCFTEEVGAFDTNFFPAYFEDNDYLYRMALRSDVVERSICDEVPSLNPHIFRASSTIQKEPKLLDGYMDKNREYYIKKWGGEPHEEKLKTPFDKK